MKATILLAEDEQAMREVLTDYFTAKSGGDFKVVPAPDGDTALHLIETRRFDLLLLDIMLPGTDGFALCRAARRQGDAPVLFVTAREDEQDKLHGYGLGADDYVVKRPSDRRAGPRCQLREHGHRYDLERRFAVQ